MTPLETKMVQLFVIMITAGRRTLESVPEKLRAAVKSALEEEKAPQAE